MASNHAVMHGRWATSRTEAFSDGVFAIAITLLVLDIDIPESQLHHLVRAILHQWPSYLAYATSFITIGGIWLAHHSIFRRLRWANTRIIRVNLALLMAVSFLPFPTRLVAESLRVGESTERVAVIFYGANLWAIALLFSALWRTVSSDRALLRPDVTDADMAAIGRASTPSVGFYVIGTAVAVLAPRVAAIAFLVIALIAVARVRSDTAAEEPG